MFKLTTFLVFSVLTNLSYASEPKEVLVAFYTALAAGDKAKATELLAP